MHRHLVCCCAFVIGFIFVFLLLTPCSKCNHESFQTSNMDPQMVPYNKPIQGWSSCNRGGYSYLEVGPLLGVLPDNSSMTVLSPLRETIDDSCKSAETTGVNLDYYQGEDDTAHLVSTTDGIWLSQ